ncbi:4Fe-4S dicluster domain-containing protein [Gordonibacter urolithinfaciens]|uniref:4Fe-4S dicluster domain-containing protein n=1 Tax=Gordonibacter urolithinfaciens TaxID=1335613 RepID=A0A6N8IJQ7_9ACTN|nr:4Fe-4S dicluster domain-containing protein [Gordonibacter urolithinfaciens]MVM55552.1 4Fe-4S dicluster domain-containing protein [Gordonibacter urolithinfaciens]MVN16129.1 4Fe-4S dicluster domain-containing protein [Gordonibacter urolithinfaciens]MVN38441.1 4Fe-4S dicluster domain-containing protein [Gordonibacter urolithinfaciens]MVN57096.1 4Fe-4S dicluster domain-containing protein [Gordonibacter urolithinfaciens]MVN62221.1 4Fe-4S dicluster domain-containing protein [Gordonibacter urolith
MSLGFYVDLQRCIGCRTCQVACKDRRDLQSAGPRPRRVDSFECGTYPDVSLFHLALSCNHCDEPACVAGCPTAALHKADDGTVQYDADRCVVCRNCMTVCPYGAPQHDEDANLIAKCDACKALRDAGRNPVCVDACPMRAIEFGELDELRAAHGGDLTSELPVLPSADVTHPNLLLRPSAGALREDFREVTL